MPFNKGTAGSADNVHNQRHSGLEIGQHKTKQAHRATLPIKIPLQDMRMGVKYIAMRKYNDNGVSRKKVEKSS